MSPRDFVETHFPDTYKFLEDNKEKLDGNLRHFVYSAIEMYRRDYPYFSNTVNKDEYRNLYTTLARAVESGDPLVIGLTVGQVVERLKTLSE